MSATTEQARIPGKRGRPPLPKKVFLKFYTADWRGDVGLRCCSLGARGLWIDMIAIMAEAEPYGHLLHQGRPVTARQLARLISAEEREVGLLLAELEENGVFSRTAEGVIYSRRMVRDAVKAEEGRELASRRWDGRGDRPRLVVHEGGAQGAPRAPAEGNIRNAENGISRNAENPNYRNAENPNYRNAENPNNRNAYSQNLELDSPPNPPTTPRPAAASPAPRSLRGAGDGVGFERKTLWQRELLSAEDGTGKVICGRWYWEDAKAMVAEAARLPGGRDWRGNWEALARWLTGRSEHEPPRELEDIIAAIENAAAAEDYEPPAVSLKFFDNRVWSYGKRRKG